MITTVRAGRVWACGGLRAEIQAESARRWRWRVWQVVGGYTVGRGSAVGVRRATEDAKARLVQMAVRMGYV